MIESCMDRCQNIPHRIAHIGRLSTYMPLVLAVLIAMLTPMWINAAPAPPDPTTQAVRLLQTTLPEAWPLQHVTVAEDVVTVCLDVPIVSLLEGNGIGTEAVEQQVYTSLIPMNWRVLYVQARDPETGECQPLSDFLPQQTISEVPRESYPSRPSDASSLPKNFSRGLEGKTIYISAGHGWRWGRDYSASSPLAWRTQRPVYEDFIEDHNNAEAVNQYLIPYLEQAGATVVPVRERDWNSVNIVVDNANPAYNEVGAWLTGTVSGYGDGIARFASTVTGTASATATWILTVPQTNLYAIYAWVGAGENHAPDAHYTVHHAGNATSLYLNQRIRPETWRYLGSFPCYAGPVTVTLDNRSATTETVVMADALRIGGGSFDTLTDIETTASGPPNKPWWESATYYYGQWMGMDPNDWSYFNDIVARPMFARWYHTPGEDALYLSWHTNGYNGTARGTESYVHNGETYPRTEGSLDLQRAVHNELIHDIRMGWDANWIDRGQKLRNLGEIRMLWDADLATRMPGMLLELGFHDHPDDAAALKNPRFNQLAARAIYQGIIHYFEARDETDLLELPETPTHLRVQNLDNGTSMRSGKSLHDERSVRGGRSVRVAWSPPSTDTAQLRGDPASGYRVYTSTDAFAWHTPHFVTDTEIILPHLKLGQTFYVRVTAVNDGGESFPTEVMGVRVGHPLLLIVNGFDKLDDTETVWENDPVEGWNQRMLVAQMNSGTYVFNHGDAVPSLYAWDSASHEAVSDGLVSLDQYSIVDWILGEEGGNEQTSALPQAAREALQAFLDNGGALLISGTNLAYDLEAQGYDPAFLHQTLHAGYVTNDAGTYTVEPTAEGAFAGLDEFHFDAWGEYDAHAPDILTTTYGATATLTYVGGRGGVAGLQYASGCTHGRSLVLGFPLEVIAPQMRATVMTHALDFLDACTLSQTLSIHSPQAGGVYSQTPAFNGLAYSINTTMPPTVAVQIARQSDGRFWSGTAWGAATWLTATGVLTQSNIFLWHYDLPPLTDDVYTLWAQVINAQGIRSSAKAVNFTFDATPPLTPTLITPMSGAVITNTEVHLAWHASVRSPSANAENERILAGGSSANENDRYPLSYHLDIDGIRHVLTHTTYTATVAPILHRWRVRAIDAAHNVGPWSEVATFTIALPATAIITSPVAGAYYSRTPRFAGNAFGNDLVHVKVQIIRERDLAAWNGSSWHTSTWIGDYAWLTATTQTPITSGLHTPLQTPSIHWAYPSMPPLEDGVYIMRAKGIAQTTSILPTPPDEVTFTYDNTRPLTPTLITPTGNITLSTGPVRMQWTAPADNGAPLVYRVGVAHSRSDMTYGQTPTPTYTQTLNTLGLYRWHVQAVDAASNRGPWSPEAYFFIVPQFPTLYLPLIMHEAAYSDQHCWTTFEDGFEQNGWQYNRAERVSAPVYDGNWAARVGILPGMSGGGEKTYASVYRTLTLPPDVSQITLQYWAYPVAEGNDADDKAYVSLKTEAGQILEVSLTPMSNAAHWEMRTHDLSKFASSTLVLNLGVINDGDDDTAAIYLDKVQIQACR